MPAPGMLLDPIVAALAQPVAGAILLNQLDDLFMDASYFLRRLHRRESRAVSLDALRKVEPQRIAVMLPAWMEADVIGHMLEHNRADVDYDPRRWDVFCGTYANDTETQARVDEMARHDRGIHKVVVPHDGPTNKADCLNWVYQGVVQEEQRRGVPFDILLMHDAEDVIHPLSLRLYSLLIPRHDFVQTPVFSLELGVHQPVAGTYIDEFAEHHLKDMRVRQAIGGLVPSAGVGSAFERKAFADIAAQNAQRPFNVESLTEDYEIGLKFRLAGKKVCFACRTVERDTVEERGLLFKRKARVRREEYIATREYFPDRLSASVRQRSRWILGITLQSWEQIGWRGSAAVRYCLWRDRKGLLNAALVVLAYLLVAYAALRGALGAGDGDGLRSVVAPGSLLSIVLAVNLWGMAWRAALKVHFVSRLYGVVQGVLSVPRLVLGNLIGIAATARAVRTYVRHRVTGEPLRWLKTAHVYPSVEALAARRKRLGELLVEREDLASEDLEVALGLQKEVELPLGEILSLAGVLPERGVLRGLAAQLALETCHPDPARISPEVLRLLPEAEAEALGALPMSRAGGATFVAVERPLSGRQRAQLEERLASSVRLVLAAATDLRRARSVAYRRLHPLAPSGRMLGERLVALHRLEEAALEEILQEQAVSGELLGERLLRAGLVVPEDLDEAFGAEGGFAVVEATDGDPSAVGKLRPSFCAIHGLVPLRRARAARAVAAAWPVHPRVAAHVAATLGEDVALVRGGSLPVRVALAVAGQAQAAARVPGTDGEELEALSARGLAERPLELLGQARARGLSPIDYLEGERRLDGEEAASLRAETLGIPLAAGGEPGGDVSAGLLPPGFACANGIGIVDASAGALVLAAPRPSAALARQAAHLMPGWSVAWAVQSQRARFEGGRDERTGQG